MKKVTYVLIVGVCLLLMNFSVTGQDEQPRSISQVDYMKVAPGDIDSYLKLEKVWKKIHQYNIKQGKYQLWSVEQVLSPTGDQYDYNYVTRVSFVDEKQYSAFIEGVLVPNNLASILTREEMKVFEKTDISRILVKSEVWQLMNEMLDEDEEDEPWRYLKFNYFVINEGFTPDDFVEVQSLWSPVHEARINDNKLEGWTVLRKLMPAGTIYSERYATVDRYQSMEALLTDDTSRYFDMLGNAEEAFKKTEEGANLARQEVRRRVMDSRK